MNLHDALDRLDALQSLADRATTLDRFSPVGTGCTAVLALLAAAMQPTLAGQDPVAFAGLWSATAAIGVTIVLIETAWRYHRQPTARSRRLTLLVIGRMAPALVAGGGLTAVIAVGQPAVLWMLPGLWAVLLGVSVYAAAPPLPAPLLAVGTWYVGAGLAALILVAPSVTPPPVAMALPFGVGQAAAAWWMSRGHWGWASG